MPSVADLVEPVGLRERAGEYLARAGDVLRSNGRVRFDDFGPTRIAASVEDGGSRSVVLEARSAALITSCTCGTVTEDGLCPHIVATAFETWDRAPNRR
jgi:uncharacterized Zn finger protein